MSLFRQIKKLFRRNKRYKVTRTWYIHAKSPIEAITRTKFLSHDMVKSVEDKSLNSLALEMETSVAAEFPNRKM